MFRRMACCTLALSLLAGPAVAGAPRRTARKVPAAPAAPVAPESEEAEAHAPVRLELPPPPAPRPAAAAEEKGPRLVRVALMDVQLSGDVAPRAAAAFSQALTPEVRKLEAVTALSAVEVREMLSVERQKMLMGCSDDSSACLAEIAGALDVDELVAVELTRVGDTYTLTARRTDMRRGQVVQSRTSRFAVRDGEELLAVVGPTVEGLYPERPLRAGRTRGVDAAVVRRLNPPPLPRWVTLGAGGVAAGTLLAGGAFGVLWMDARNDHDALVRRATTGVVPATELAAVQERVQSRAMTANTLFLAGGSLGLATLVGALFTDWADDRAAFSAQPVVAPGGAGVQVSGAF